MPTPSLEKAAAIAEVSKKHGGVFVFAARDQEIFNAENASAEIAKYPFAEYACKDCGTHYHGISGDGLQPYCVTCASEEVSKVADSKPTIPLDSEMSALACTACGTKHAFRTELSSACDSIHCTACGTPMKTTADADIVGDDGPAVDADDMELVDIDEPIDELSETTQEDPKPGADAPLSADPKTTDTVTQELPADKADPVLPADPVAPSTTQQEVTSDADEGLEDVEIDLTNELDGEDDLELSFVYLGKKVTLVHNEQIIASLHEDAAGDNKDMLQSDSFRQAVAHSVSTLGLKKALAQYNFTPNKVKAKLTKTLASKVEARVQEKTKTLTTAQAEVMADVTQSIEIAAAGFAGNFWKKADPLKVALAAELKAVGVKNSTVFVDKIFAAHGVAHLRGVLDMARELIKKPPEARNSLAESIDLARYQPMVIEAKVDGDDEDMGDDDSDVIEVASAVSVDGEKPAPSRTYRSSEISKILGDNPLPFAN